MVIWLSENFLNTKMEKRSLFTVTQHFINELDEMLVLKLITKSNRTILFKLFINFPPE